MKILCWLPIALVVYSYLLYPACLCLVAGLVRAARRLFRLGHRRGSLQEDPARPTQPAVAVVFSAFNEARHVRSRIANLLAQRYPAELLTVYVGSDGSSDETEAILRGLEGVRVRAYCFEENRGKATVLNDLLGKVTEPVVVFTDANTEFAPDAVPQLVAALGGPGVGCVCGELRLAASIGDNPDGSYWSVERMLKRCESEIGGLLGANGGIYAIRRECYRQLRSDTICDDFIIAMRVRTQGRRVIYCSTAIAREDTPASIGDEVKRRRRIGTGNYQALFRHPEFFWKAGAVTALTYFSHKVLRWLTPHLLLVTLLASFALAREPLYLGFAVLQVAGYSVLGLLYAMRDRMQLRGPLAGLVFLFALNVAFLLASIGFLRGRASGAWERTERA